MGEKTGEYNENAATKTQQGIAKSWRKLSSRQLREFAKHAPHDNAYAYAEHLLGILDVLCIHTP